MPDDLQQLCPVFVTLFRKGELRGCVGTLEPRSVLAHAVIQTAAAAATEDPRFPTLGSEELPEISVEISILSPFRPIQRFEEIVPRRHGVLVKRNKQRGLFLPQVWADSGWDRQTFLEELCVKKAGLTLAAVNDPKTEWFVFEVDSFASE